MPYTKPPFAFSSIIYDKATKCNFSCKTSYRLFHNHLHQLIVAVHHIVDDAVVADGGKVGFGALDLKVLNAAQLIAVKQGRAFGFGNKIDMLLKLF